MTIKDFMRWLFSLETVYPIDRRSNRSSVPDQYIEQYSRLRNALAEIANMTEKEMPDHDEFRIWAQNKAHNAIAGRTRLSGVTGVYAKAGRDSWSPK